MTLDSHQHFWKYTPEEYPWIDADKWRIAQSFLPIDLEAALRPLGIEGSIAVQARQSLAESEWLLELADASPAVKGVVGWVDLRGPAAEKELARLGEHPKFVGVRHVAQDEPDDDFLIQDDFVRGVSLLHQFDLAYDLLIYPRQLPAAIELVNRLPRQKFVLDHMAKPFVKAGLLEPWKKHITELALSPNVHCKISGLVTEASWTGWRRSDFIPYLNAALEAFGPDRLMFGSDWPVCLLAGGYYEVHDLVLQYFQAMEAPVRSKVFGDNAARFYGIRDSV